MKTIKNVRVSYIYSFIASFDFTDAIWVLYLAFRGMSLFEIGLLEGIFHITSLLFEMPTGAIADTFGRKRAIILGRIAAIASGLLLFFGRDFFVFALAMILSAMSFNLNS
ncbi:MAG: MFS transporter, partial [Ruminococcaceae bacterium]|nr:MFS transporter [Oscillospiraceae bacterium]